MKVNGPGSNKLSTILDVLREAESVAMCGHTGPDGDCIGSQLGLRPWLESHGTTVEMLSPDPIPTRFKFLEGTEDFRLDEPSPVDVAILMDCGNIDRTGPFKQFMLDQETLINLDHHPQDEPPGEYFHVDPSLACVGELVFRMYETDGSPLPEAACQPLYVSLMTDTGGFKHSNTGPRSHYVASKLLEAGDFCPHETYKKLYEQESLEATKLLGTILKRASASEGVVWSQVSREDLTRSGIDPEDVNGAVELLRRIDCCEVAILFWERPGGEIKINFRSKHDFELREPVQELGGGGHNQAAGATMEGDLETVREQVLDRFKKELSQQNGPAGT